MRVTGTYQHSNSSLSRQSNLKEIIVSSVAVATSYERARGLSQVSFCMIDWASYVVFQNVAQLDDGI